MAGIAAVIRLNSERRLNTLLAGQTRARLSERIEGDGSIIVAHVGEMRRQHVQRAGPQRQQGARPRKLAVGLTGSAKLQADLFLQPNEDGLFPGFTQTRASGTTCTTSGSRRSSGATSTTLLDRVKKSSGPIAANRVRAALSAFWTWGLRTGRIEVDSNPVSFTIRQPERSRDRTLTDAEIKAIWRATAGDDDYSRIVRLCMLTGCRREEIGGLRWDEIEPDRLAIGATRMKGAAVHEIPILPAMAGALPCRLDMPPECVFGRRGTEIYDANGRVRTLVDQAADAKKAPSWRRCFLFGGPQ
jgi:hypothetical protein